MRKQRYGTGSIRERRPGYFEAQFSFGRKPDGTRDRRTFATHRKPDAEAWLRSQTPWDPDPDGLPVAAHRLDAWMDRWLAGIEPTVRATTFAGYESFNRIWITPLIGTIPLARLSATDARRVPAAILRQGKSPSTASAGLTVLRMALRQAVRDGLISRNVAEAVKPPRQTREPVRAITVEQVHAVLAATKDSLVGPVVSVAIGTGLRIGEILAIRPEDIHADTITVTGSMRRVPGKGLVRQPPKTARSVRTVGLTSIAREGLAEQRSRQKAANRISPLVFPYDPVNVTHLFQAQLRRASLPAMRFHDLRHAYATLMLGAGVPLRVVQSSLGHTSIELTARVYAHVLPELSRTGAEQFDRLLERR